MESRATNYIRAMRWFDSKVSHYDLLRGHFLNLLRCERSCYFWVIKYEVERSDSKVLFIVFRIK